MLDVDVHPQGGRRADRAPRRTRCRASARRDLPLARARRSCASGRVEEHRRATHGAGLQGPAPRVRSCDRRAARGAACGADRRSRRRDRVGQGPHAWIPTATSTRLAPTAAGRNVRLAETADLYRALRAGEAAAARLRLRRPARVPAPTRSSATRCSRPRSAGVSGRSSSTSSRTRHRSSCGCCAPGSGPSPTSASSATLRRRSTGSPAPTPRRCAQFDSHFAGATHARARSQLPLDPAGRRVLGRRARRRRPGAARRPRGASRWPVTVDPRLRRRRGRGRRPLHRDVGRRSRTAFPMTASACCSGPTRSRRSSRPRWPDAASRHAPARAAGSSSDPWCRTLLAELREAEREDASREGAVAASASCSQTSRPGLPRATGDVG